LKARFRILVNPPHYDMDIQARLPPALAAIHNFIRIYDPDDINDYDNFFDEEHGCREQQNATGDLANGPPTNQARERGNSRRDEIAALMWADYQRYLAEGGDPVEPLD
jgi:hypothetical protein